MLQMLLVMHEALTKAKQADYLREVEEHRRAVAAERGYKPARTTGPRTVARLRQMLVRAGITRVPAHGR